MSGGSARHEHRDERPEHRGAAAVATRAHTTWDLHDGGSPVVG